MSTLTIELDNFRSLYGIQCDIHHQDVETEDGYSYTINKIKSLYYVRTDYPSIPITLEPEEVKVLTTWLEEEIQQYEDFIQEVLEFNGVEMEPFVDGCQPYAGILYPF